MKLNKSKVIIAILLSLLIIVSTILVITLIKLNQIYNSGYSVLPGNKVGQIEEINNVELLSSTNEKISFNDEGKDSTSPFYITNMFPGDSISKTYVATINDDAALGITFSATYYDNTVNPTDAQLNRDRSLMNLVVTANGQELYNGPVDTIDDIDEFDINGVSKVTFVITISLDESAGNEYAKLNLAMVYNFEYRFEERYTVTYSDGIGGDAFLSQVSTLKVGSDTPPFNGTPSRSGYKFIGWDPEVSSTVTANVTYEAKWEELYTVTYVDGSGDENYFASQSYNDLEKNSNTPSFNGTPSRSGYKFTGWTPEVASTVTANVTYTANWEELYTVAYVDGSGEETYFASQSYNDLEKNSNTPSFNGTPTRSGYKFTGWTPEVASTVTSNVTYEANWEELYTVTYVDGSGDENYFASQSYNNLEKNSNTPSFNGTPSRSGYKFTGWTPEISSTVTANVTYSANWEELYTVTYVDGSGEETHFTSQSFNDLEKDSNTPSFDGTPSREGYTFKGWTPEVASTVTANVTYTANWEEITYTITYTDGTGEEEFFSNQVFSNISKNTVTPSFNGTPTRDGYKFVGWTPEVSSTVTASVTYTVKWSEFYTVSYVDGSGENAYFKAQSYSGLEKNDQTPLFNGTPTRDGYKFVGWTPEVQSLVSSNTIYTATWEKLYKVIYIDGSSYNIYFEPQVYTNLEKNSYTPSFIGTPQRQGYVFKGWTPVPSLTVTSNVVYTAIWEQNSYVVTYTDGVDNVEIFADMVFSNVVEGSQTPVFTGILYRTGYTFDGWNPDISSTVTANITYTAKWKEIEIQQLIIDDENHEVETEIELDKTKSIVWEGKYKFKINVDGYTELYCDYLIPDGLGKDVNKLKITIECKETGVVVYNGYLVNMPNHYKSVITGKAGEEFIYTVTISLAETNADDFTANINLKWMIEDGETHCHHCIICFLVNKFIGPYCLWPYCWIIYSVILVLIILGICKHNKSKKNKGNEDNKGNKKFKPQVKIYIVKDENNTDENNTNENNVDENNNEINNINKGDN